MLTQAVRAQGWDEVRVSPYNNRDIGHHGQGGGSVFKGAEAAADSARGASPSSAKPQPEEAHNAAALPPKPKAHEAPSGRNAKARLQANAAPQEGRGECTHGPAASRMG
jgi:hypothetical protein